MSAENIKKFDEVVQDIIDCKDYVGLSISIFTSREILYYKVFGDAVYGVRKLKSNDKFCIGSNFKSMLCLAISLAIESGDLKNIWKISLREFFGDSIHPKFYDVLVIDLANHRSGNQLTRLPDNLPPGLTTLYCSYNQLTDLPDILPSGLTVLYCSDNQLTCLPYSLICCRRLSSIVIYNNPIEHNHPAVVRFVSRIRERRQHAPTIYTDAQSVHNTHVQESIRNSIASIIKISSKAERDSFNIEDVLHDEALVRETKDSLIEYCEDKTEHSLFGITFGELFTDVWNRIQKHPERNEIKRILNTEMQDALCKCFTGRISRLVNCLSGFFEDIEVKIGDSEQISNVIAVVKEKLEKDGEYTVEKHREMVRKELLERNYEEKVVDEWLVFIE